ncbi:aldose 1-epimerase [Botrimarina hoheduenensis]|uniref:Aldose 1-epimerase n=1 Tax=Botrimarina hoheduenensis TaxID=2528000 RepID=A0A5C5WCM2_9BACT|nr:aldose 1-epimerase [Botrimarina hoheduenensis]TWT47825.1 Aldose 1-epimerase [Botrimarina hoheduenensis]
MSSAPVTIQDPASGSSASLLPSLGFNCFSWRPALALAEGPATPEMLWAEEEFAQGSGRPSRSGTPLLFPFPGRIRAGAFEFEGNRYQVEPSDGLGNAIHGFALRAAWRVVEQTTEAITAEYQPSIDDPDAVGQWTGDYRLRATYRVVGTRLDLSVAATNLSDHPLPFGFGTHAYFRLPLAGATDDAEATIVRAPVDAVWNAAGLVPDGGTAPLGALGESLPAGGALAGREFDTPYRFASGARETVIHDPRSGVTLTQTFDESMRCCVIYTPGHREAICLEPYTCVPNPFELEAAGIDTGLLVLAPGETYRTAIGLEVSVA